MIIPYIETVIYTHGNEPFVDNGIKNKIPLNSDPKIFRIPLYFKVNTLDLNILGYFFMVAISYLAGLYFYRIRSRSTNDRNLIVDSLVFIFGSAIAFVFSYFISNLLGMDNIIIRLFFGFSLGLIVGMVLTDLEGTYGKSTRHLPSKP